MKQHSKLLAYSSVGLFLLVMILFFQAGAHDFTNLDDYPYTKFNRFVKGGISLDNVLGAFSTFSLEAIYMPLTTLSYMLEASLWGLNAGTLHLVNVFIHSCNTVFLFWLLCLIVRGVQTAKGVGVRALIICSMAALIWGLHPQRVEPVAWIASRKDVLFVFFELAALIAWIKQLSSAGQKQAVWFRISFGLFLAACLCKPSAMTFPLIAAAMEYFLLRKISWSRYQYLFSVMLFVAALTTYSQATGGGHGHTTDFTKDWLLLNAIASIGEYLRQFFWPVDLCLIYPPRFPELPDHWLFGILTCSVLLLVALAGVYKYRKNEKPIVWGLVCLGLFWFGISILPTLGFPKAFGYHSHADRFTYFPMIGLSVLFLVVDQASIRLQRLVLPCGLVLLVFFSALTVRQLGFWRNDALLFGRTLTCRGDDNFMAHYILAIYEYAQNHDVAEASKHFGRAFELKRESCRRAQVPYIIALAENGAIEMAKTETRDLMAYNEAQSQETGQYAAVSAGSYHCYAMIALQEGDIDLAKEQLEKVFVLNPDECVSNYIAGLIAEREGRVEDAAEHYKKAISAGKGMEFRFLRPKITSLQNRIGK